MSLFIFNKRFLVCLIIGCLPFCWGASSDSLVSHWAYVTPEHPNFSRIDNPNPIDHFISERLRKDGMRLSRLAKPEKQLRRVYLDLICLLYTSPSPRD